MCQCRRGGTNPTNICRWRPTHIPDHFAASLQAGSGQRLLSTIFNWAPPRRVEPHPDQFLQALKHALAERLGHIAGVPVPREEACNIVAACRLPAAKQAARQRRVPTSGADRQRGCIGRHAAAGSGGHGAYLGNSAGCPQTGPASAPGNLPAAPQPWHPPLQEGAGFRA